MRLSATPKASAARRPCRRRRSLDVGSAWLFSSPHALRALSLSPRLLSSTFPLGLQGWSESSVALEMDGQQHYVRGGKPGYFPTLKDKIPHTIPFNYFDPFGLSGKATPEKKAKGLLAEINNGRLAMIGIIGLVSASKGLIVPGLDTLPIPKYAGEVMAPFSATNGDLPYVTDMLSWAAPF